MHFERAARSKTYETQKPKKPNAIDVDASDADYAVRRGTSPSGRRERRAGGQGQLDGAVATSTRCHRPPRIAAGKLRDQHLSLQRFRSRAEF
jgi:hypothetical protein